jgi:O-antigen ligase
VIPFVRSASLPIAVLLVVAPAMAVAQFRIMAPAVTIALALTLVAHWRNHRSVPWPRPWPLLAPALALLGWAALSALWAIEPDRALGTVASLVGLLLLGGAAARALAQDAPEHRARLGTALVIGLGIGIPLLAFDHGSQNLFRLAVRGFPPWTPFVDFGLKPTVSLVALLLPLVLAVPRAPLALSAALIIGGAAVALWLPGESAKIAAIAGLLAAFAARYAPRLVARAAALSLAAVFLAAPLLFAAVLDRAPNLAALPPSAAHRVLIWNFVTDRIAERPLLGWGMESSREIPGGAERFDRATLDRFGLTSPEARDWFGAEAARRLPLHTHNNALQVWLELGLIGAALAAGLAAAVMLAAGAAPYAPAALGAAVAGAATGQLSFGVWQPWWIASLVLVAVVLSALPRERAQG